MDSEILYRPLNRYSALTWAGAICHAYAIQIEQCLIDISRTAWIGQFEAYLKTPVVHIGSKLVRKCNG